MSAPATPGILLDTHTLLWYAADDAKLPTPVRQLVRDKNIPCFVSVVSLWEITILVNLKRLDMAPDLDTWLTRVRSQFPVLDIKDSHLASYAALPQIKDHRDPFDRLLIAQAMSEGLTLVSRDVKFEAYEVPVRWDKK